MKYAVVIEKARRNWCAYVPDLPGCVSTGGTFKKTQSNIREAISMQLDGMRVDGDKPPRASTRVGVVEVPRR